MRLIKSKNKDATVVALTAEAIYGDRERFLSDGFDGYLEKPIDEQALLAILKDCFSKQNESSYFETLEATLGIDREFALVLLRDFVNDSAEDIKEMNAAVASNNINDIFELAHKIKGAAANLRLDDVRGIAFTMEKNAREGVSEFDYAAFAKKLADTISKINIED
jgi:HPt (histidine-containing phosphotransfer) domain-containing protein